MLLWCSRTRGWAGSKYRYSSLRCAPTRGSNPNPAYQLCWRVLSQLQLNQIWTETTSLRLTRMRELHLLLYDLTLEVFAWKASFSAWPTSAPSVATSASWSTSIPATTTPTSARWLIRRSITSATWTAQLMTETVTTPPTTWPLIRAWTAKGTSAAGTRHFLFFWFRFAFFLFLPVPGCRFPPFRCQAKCLTLRHVRMHRVIFYISNTLRKPMIIAQGLVFTCVGLGLEKEKYLRSKSNIFQRLKQEEKKKYFEVWVQRKEKILWGLSPIFFNG